MVHCLSKANFQSNLGRLLLSVRMPHFRAHWRWWEGAWQLWALLVLPLSRKKCSAGRQREQSNLSCHPLRCGDSSSLADCQWIYWLLMKWREKCLSMTSIQKRMWLKTPDYFLRYLRHATTFWHHAVFGWLVGVVFCLLVCGFLYDYVLLWLIFFFSAAKLIKMDISNKLSNAELQKFFTVQNRPGKINNPRSGRACKYWHVQARKQNLGTIKNGLGIAVFQIIAWKICIYLLSWLRRRQL